MFRLFDKDVEREEEELQNFIDFTLITTERQSDYKWNIRKMTNYGTLYQSLIFSYGRMHLS